MSIATAERQAIEGESIWIRTAEGNGQGGYGWRQVRFVGPCEWEDTGPRGDLVAWTAWEANRNPCVPAGQVVRATCHPSIGELRFLADAPGTSGGREVPPIAGDASAEGLAEGDRLFIRLVEDAGDGRYSWREAVPDDAGGWLDGRRQGTLERWTAFEANHTAGLPLGIVIHAWASAHDALYFQMGTC